MASRLETRTKGNAFLVRVRVITACFGLIALVCVGRLYYLQVFKAASYAEAADRQFVEPTSPLFDRGKIFFTTKDGAELVAASNQNGVSLAVEPPKVSDMQNVYDTLNAITPLDHDTFFSKVGRPEAQYVVVANHLATSTGANIAAKALPGIVVADDRWRFYPGNELAAQELGFVAYNGDALEGRYGLERFYETLLARSDADIYTNFFVQLFAGFQKTIHGQDSGDVITTIEPSVQSELERELSGYIDAWHPQFAGGIIMDPQTGEIVAMAQQPSFDLNIFSQSDPAYFSNKLVESSYEMGSIVKPLTMAAGLDAGVITATSTYNDTGCIELDQKKICNFDGKARGIIPMQQILSQSLNVGASYIATKLGPDRMRNYFTTDYQFGAKTGIDLPAEASGQIGNFQSPRQVEYDTASFGQGFAATAVQTVRALGSLANGGYLVTPHLVKTIRYESGLQKDIPVQKIAILRPQAVQQVQQMLTEVVDTSLANGDTKLEHYSVAAKTGTAQIADPQNGGYYSDRYLHSFFGFFPSYNARFIIFLFAFEPQGAQYASQTWTNVFSDLTKFLINYYNIPPDR